MFLLNKVKAGSGFGFRRCFYPFGLIFLVEVSLLLLVPEAVLFVCADYVSFYQHMHDSTHTFIHASCITKNHHSLALCSDLSYNVLGSVDFGCPS